MISLVLYGRNDSYGYNLHKRAAISLNCMAEVLSDPSDEIVFVDYNTPDDFPTFPEAIQDTLTAKAKSLLRILRVRPKHHERFREKTHLVALEPIARNVAIRRSNPNNRWILSTNTDMVFVPRRGKTLSEIAGSLIDGYYHLPRFEVPETLWESVDRMDAPATIAAFEAWGREYHLNEVVYAQEKPVYYDAPGDFQLMLRSDAWKIYGFDESMLLGWHVDSNMAKRLWLMHERVGDLVEDVFGYHCDHTRQVTPMHRAQATQNDLKVYFDLVRSAPVSAQRKTWGLAGEAIEEISLAPEKSVYAAALAAATPVPLAKPTAIRYAGATYNHIDYSAAHVLPFLTDSLQPYPHSTVVGWIGAKKSLLQGFSAVWRGMGFSTPILVFSDARWLGPDLPEGCVLAPADDVCDQADVFIFDWGRPEDDRTAEQWEFDRDPILRQVAQGFRRAIRIERARLKKGEARPRRFIGVNAINNAMEGVFGNHIGAARTPIATRIRQGFVAPDRGITSDLLAALYIGEAGQRTTKGIVPLPGLTGWVFFGPYLDLDSGVYRITLEFSGVKWPRSDAAALTLDAVSHFRLLGCREIDRRDLAKGSVSLEFLVPPEISEVADWPRIEVRLRTPGSIAFTVRRAELRKIEKPKDVRPLQEFEVAPLLVVGPAGIRDARGIRARRGVRDLLSYGPYYWLPNGHYEATFRFFAGAAKNAPPIRVHVAYHLGMDLLGRASLAPAKTGFAECAIPFSIGEDPPHPQDGLLEFLARTGGNRRLSLVSVKIKPAARSRATRAKSRRGELIRFMIREHAGRCFGNSIVAAGDVSGIVFRSPELPLPRGKHRVQLAVRSLDPKKVASRFSGLTLTALGDGHVLGSHRVDTREIARGRATLDFEVALGGWGSEVELVLHTAGLIEAEISSMIVTEGTGRIKPTAMPDVDLLTVADPGPMGAWSIAPGPEQLAAIRANRGRSNVAVSTPALTLREGNYRIVLDAIAVNGKEGLNVKVDAAEEGATDTVVAKRVAGAFALSVPKAAQYRVRVWASPKTEFYITGIRLSPSPELHGGSNGRTVTESQPNGLQRRAAVTR